jgi:hypothetical protein
VSLPPKNAQHPAGVSLAHEIHRGSYRPPHHHTLTEISIDGLLAGVGKILSKPGALTEQDLLELEQINHEMRARP